ncbi:unnamed protein product [Amoebophrya sp. A120]|nr:unnamed protein product [Amoebophrya sp. A120]|eukprot:GSA120T00025695001.1
MKQRVAFRMLRQLGFVPNAEGSIVIREEEHAELYESLLSLGLLPLRPASAVRNEGGGGNSRQPGVIRVREDGSADRFLAKHFPGPGGVDPELQGGRGTSFGSKKMQFPFLAKLLEADNEEGAQEPSDLPNGCARVRSATASLTQAAKEAVLRHRIAQHAAANVVEIMGTTSSTPEDEHVDGVGGSSACAELQGARRRLQHERFDLSKAEPHEIYNENYHVTICHDELEDEAFVDAFFTEQLLPEFPGGNHDHLRPMYSSEDQHPCSPSSFFAGKRNAASGGSGFMAGRKVDRTTKEFSQGRVNNLFLKQKKTSRGDAATRDHRPNRQGRDQGEKEMRDKGGAAVAETPLSARAKNRLGILPPEEHDSEVTSERSGKATRPGSGRGTAFKAGSSSAGSSAASGAAAHGHGSFPVAGGRGGPVPSTAYTEANFQYELQHQRIHSSPSARRRRRLQSFEKKINAPPKKSSAAANAEAVEDVAENSGTSSGKQRKPSMNTITNTFWHGKPPREKPDPEVVAARQAVRAMFDRLAEPRQIPSKEDDKFKNQVVAKRTAEEQRLACERLMQKKESSASHAGPSLQEDVVVADRTAEESSENIKRGSSQKAAPSAGPVRSAAQQPQTFTVGAAYRAKILPDKRKGAKAAHANLGGGVVLRGPPANRHTNAVKSKPSARFEWLFSKIAADSQVLVNFTNLRGNDARELLEECLWTAIMVQTQSDDGSKLNLSQAMLAQIPNLPQLCLWLWQQGEMLSSWAFGKIETELPLLFNAIFHVRDDNAHERSMPPSELQALLLGGHRDRGDEELRSGASSSSTGSMSSHRVYPFSKDTRSEVILEKQAECHRIVQEMQKTKDLHSLISLEELRLLRDWLLELAAVGIGVQQQFVQEGDEGEKSSSIEQDHTLTRTGEVSRKVELSGGAAGGPEEPACTVEKKMTGEAVEPGQESEEAAGIKTVKTTFGFPTTGLTSGRSVSTGSAVVIKKAKENVKQDEFTFEEEPEESTSAEDPSTSVGEEGQHLLPGASSSCSSSLEELEATTLEEVAASASTTLTTTATTTGPGAHSGAQEGIERPRPGASAAAGVLGGRGPGQETDGGHETKAFATSLSFPPLCNPKSTSVPEQASSTSLSACVDRCDEEERSKGAAGADPKIKVHVGQEEVSGAASCAEPALVAKKKRLSKLSFWTKDSFV